MMKSCKRRHRMVLDISILTKTWVIRILLLVAAVSAECGDEHQNFCWESDFPTTSGDYPSKLDIDELNKMMFFDLEESIPFYAVPYCYPNTTFEFTAQPAYKDPFLYPKQSSLGSPPELAFIYQNEEMSLHFKLTISPSDMKDFDEVLTQPPPPEDLVISVWFRVIGCLVGGASFCHPFVDADDWITFNSSKNGVTIEGEPWKTETSNSSSSNQEAEPVITIATNWFEAPDILRMNRTHYETSLNTSIVIPKYTTGDYMFVGHAVVCLQSNNSDVYYRLDMLDSPPVCLVSLKEQPTIEYILRGTKIFVGVAIGVSDTLVLVILYLIWKYRNHRVMTLAQSGLLAAMAVCSFLAIFLTFLYLPTRDIFCRLDSVSMIPNTMIATIMTGRLFRVYATLSHANKFARRNSETQSRVSSGVLAEDRVIKIMMILAFSRFGNNNTKSRNNTRNNIRQTASREDSVRLIFVLSIPQLILQILDFSLFSPKSVIEFDDEGTYGRQACENHRLVWLSLLEVIVVALQYLLVLLLAWWSRDLPDAFNETSQIFRAAIVNGIMSVFVIGLLVLFNLPSTSPNVTVVLQILLTIVVALVPCWVILFPKIRRAMSGEQIVISNLLRGMGSTVAVKPSGLEFSSVPAVNGASEMSADIELSNLAENEHELTGDDTSSKVVFRKGDPLPKEMEREIFRLDELVSSLKKKCESGKAIDSVELTKLHQTTTSISGYMNQMSLESSSENNL